MSEKEMFDAGNAITIHERNTRHFQCGDRVSALYGSPSNYERIEGEIVGWWDGTEGRRARVKFQYRGGTFTKSMDTCHLKLVRNALPSDRVELRRHAAQLRYDGDDAAATLAEDAWLEATD